MHLITTKSTQRLSGSTQRKQRFMHRYKATPFFRGDYVNRDGYSDVAIRFTINGQRWVKSLEIKCLPQEWDKQAKRLIRKPGDVRRMELNMKIEQALGRAFEIFHRALVTDASLSVDRFRTLYNEEDKYYDFLLFMERELEARLKAHEISASTGRIDRCTINKLRQFREQITFSDLTENFFREFDTFYFQGSEKRAGLNNLVKYKKKISVYIERAIRMGYNIKNPIKINSRDKEKTGRTALTPEELEQLVMLRQDPLVDGRLREVLEAMLFSASNGGFRISDLKALGAENLNGNILSFIPYKTRRRSKVLVTIELNDFGLDIIRARRDRERFFDLPTDQRVNYMLKELQARAGIKTRITSHIFRHTYASLYVNWGGLPVNLAAIMGITLMVATDYVHCFQNRATKSNTLLNAFFKPLDSPSAQNQNLLPALPKSAQ